MFKKILKRLTWKDPLVMMAGSHEVRWDVAPDTTIPRPYSICEFNPPDECEEQYPLNNQYPLNANHTYIYLSEIPNMPGHCVVLDSATGELHNGYRIDNFVEINNR